MNDPKTIDIDPNPTQAVALRQQSGAVGRALTLEELSSRLQFVRDVMQRELREGVDYGKIPGCGEKPTLMQPGAQKLLLTFNLREQIKKEVLREFPNLKVFGHREYELTVSVFPAGQRPEDGWDGVGTCSTLEAKYRYRKGERVCPKCAKPTIIKGKAEYGGGWLCFSKRGGCGAKFADNDPQIANQNVGQTEHDNPADYWNTVRKMAFKRALVAASINATNTSELWTQDIEEMGRAAAEEPQAEPEPQTPPSRPTQAQKPAAAPKQQELAPRVATDATRSWMLKELNADTPNPDRSVVREFMDKAGILMPMEELEDLPMRYVPINREQLRALITAIKDFANGEPAKYPFRNEEAPPAKKGGSPAQPTPPQPGPATTGNPTPTTGSSQSSRDPEWWRDIVVPIPRRGMKRDAYLKAPDTIGSLYEARHGSDDEAQEARQRLFGFVNNYEPKPWKKQNGEEVPPSAADIQFREALDAFADWFEKNHPDEKL